MSNYPSKGKTPCPMTALYILLLAIGILMIWASVLLYRFIRAVSGGRVDSINATREEIQEEISAIIYENMQGNPATGEEAVKPHEDHSSTQHRIPM
ncbi:hypothetical protein NEAUS04_1767 [Nematocida ausubeli]|nr:hypothetical protein NEAUS07_0559 [Nematocida ausubeli]KAI5150479.1 hypothetical protein NEAUS05_2184 [Nematocida ausubeli]KAI5163698.1 hypothetical protein NEAUS04_1767 [Nematocida ausubeli]